MDTNDQFIERDVLKVEHKAVANNLEHCVTLLQQYIRCLRGEVEDLTGLGLWRIFCNNLEAATDCKVITKIQWYLFLDMQRKLYATAYTPADKLGEGDND